MRLISALLIIVAVTGIVATTTPAPTSTHAANVSTPAPSGSASWSFSGSSNNHGNSGNMPCSLADFGVALNFMTNTSLSIAERCGLWPEVQPCVDGTAAGTNSTLAWLLLNVTELLYTAACSPPAATGGGSCGGFFDDLSESEGCGVLKGNSSLCNGRCVVSWDGAACVPLAAAPGFLGSYCSNCTTTFLTALRAAERRVADYGSGGEGSGGSETSNSLFDFGIELSVGGLQGAAGQQYAACEAFLGQGGSVGRPRGGATTTQHGTTTVSTSTSTTTTTTTTTPAPTPAPPQWLPSCHDQLWLNDSSVATAVQGIIDVTNPFPLLAAWPESTIGTLCDAASTAGVRCFRRVAASWLVAESLIGNPQADCKRANHTAERCAAYGALAEWKRGFLQSTTRSALCSGPAASPKEAPAVTATCLALASQANASQLACLSSTYKAGPAATLTPACESQLKSLFAAWGCCSGVLVPTTVPGLPTAIAALVSSAAPATCAWAPTNTALWPPGSAPAAAPLVRYIYVNGPTLWQVTNNQTLWAAMQTAIVSDVVTQFGLVGSRVAVAIPPGLQRRGFQAMADGPRTIVELTLSGLTAADAESVGAQITAWTNRGSATAPSSSGSKDSSMTMPDTTALLVNDGYLAIGSSAGGGRAEAPTPAPPPAPPASSGPSPSQPGTPPPSGGSPTTEAPSSGKPASHVVIIAVIAAVVVVGLCIGVVACTRSRRRPDAGETTHLTSSTNV